MYKNIEILLYASIFLVKQSFPNYLYEMKRQ